MRSTASLLPALPTLEPIPALCTKETAPQEFPFTGTRERAVSSLPALGALHPDLLCLHPPHASSVCAVVSGALRPRGLQPAGLLCPWDSPGKDTASGCHVLLQGIFPTQGSHPSLTSPARGPHPSLTPPARGSHPSLTPPARGSHLHRQAGSSPLAPPGNPEVAKSKIIWYWICKKMTW